MVQKFKVKNVQSQKNLVPQCAEKLVFFTLNTVILQSVQSKILDFFSYIFILVRCKILWLDLKKQIQFFLLFTIEMIVLSVSFADKGFLP